MSFRSRRLCPFYELASKQVPLITSENNVIKINTFSYVISKIKYIYINKKINEIFFKSSGSKNKKYKSKTE